jgi:mannose-1-phosphate guanylyltransferase/mannose-6-phosphate isomerase
LSLHVLVLAGGSGTRLWPLSRAARPKHLLPLGSGGHTLLHSTLERVAGIGDDVHVVTAAAQAEACAAVLQEAGLDPSAVIAEPVARGTGPAMGLATGLLVRRDPDALVVSVHADHRVAGAGTYRAAILASAGWAAATGGLATVGLTPTRPATGFGYIALGEQLDAQLWRDPTSRAPTELSTAAGALPAYHAAGFVEKPSAETAERYVAQGDHLWNLGLFAWPAAAFLEELRGADPGLAAGLDEVIEARLGGDEVAAARGYAALRSEPVEPLVMERTQNLTVCRASFTWSDVGSWADLHEARAADGELDVSGNAVDGEALLVDVHNSTVVSRGGRLVTVVGASGLVIVDTPDALLVMPAEESQRVKEAVERLREQGRAELL